MVSWTESPDNPSGDELGALRRRIAILETENASLAESARQADLQFHDLADHIRQVVSIVDANFEFQVYVSPGYEALWERTRETLYAEPKSWLEAVHPEDIARVRKALRASATFDEEFRLTRKGGDPRWVRMNFAPILNGAGEVVRFVSFTEDVTDWKRMETTLVQSQKMDAVGRLAGGIAHDFNNLLTVINGYSVMLSERLDISEEILGDLASIRKAGERAAALTAQLLAFSRKGMGQAKIIDLRAAVAGVEPMLRRLIRENVELATVDLGGPVTVKVDSTQLEQVIINLVINARDSIESETPGKITIESGTVDFDAETGRLHAFPGAGRYGMLAVSDTGCGMSASTQERIFEPFFTTKEMGHGTGLGLATVYGIVKQSGGTIWVYSEEGMGTTFRIYLPVVESAAAAEAPALLEKAAGGSGIILLVEDDEQVRMIASEVLKKRGYTVLQAPNGEAAIEIAAGLSAIDLLVTDVVMPKMGGRELAAGLASMHPTMKVLFISGYTENAVIHMGNMQRAMNHLAKPFSPDALSRKVSEILAPKTMTAG